MADKWPARGANGQRDDWPPAPPAVCGGARNLQGEWPLFKCRKMKSRLPRDFRLASAENRAQSPAHEQFSFQHQPLLPDHADLLRERAAAPGPCLLDDCVR